MQILIIEDDRLMARSIALMLDSAGIQHQAAATGEAGIELARLYDFDAIVLDLSLPDIYGYRVLKQLRSARVATPVMIVSGDTQLATKVSGFGIGADDYLTKPFVREELIARLHALVRRSQGHAQPIVQTGTMTIDLNTRVVSVQDKRIALSNKEYLILEMLSVRKGLTLNKEAMIAKLYGGRDEPEIKIIDVFICKLRKKLADVDPCAAACIETVWGRGYALRDPEGEPITRAA